MTGNIIGRDVLMHSMVVLREFGARCYIQPDLIVGTSVGALNGVFLAGRPGPAGIDELEGIWRSLRRRDVLPRRM